MLLSLFSFLLAVGILVSFHEYGHYLAAKLCGVEVERFSIGLGKPLFSFKPQASKTEWVISRIPLGGYVKLNEASFDDKPLWKRALVVAAGPIANFILAVIFLFILYISGVKQLPAKLVEPPAHSLAYAAGIYQGDQVVGWKEERLNDFREIISWNQLRWRLMDAITAKNDFWLKIKTKEGELQEAEFLAERFPPLLPDSDPIAALGISPSTAEPIAWFEYRADPLTALMMASERTRDITIVSLRMLGGIFTGEASVKQIGGPISIAGMAGQSAQVGWQSFMGFLALISISLGILNLLPLPMLDGGQLLYDAWELATGRKIPKNWRFQLQRLGVLCLLLLTFLALFNDVTKLLVR